MTEKLTRRDLAGRVAYGSFWAATGGALLGMLKLLMPAVTPEASTRVKLGHPDEFPPGTARVFTDRHIFVLSEADGVYALSTECPHLGCIVTRLPEGQFDCPCHGSRFNTRGEVFSGPSPRGLSWLEIRRAPNGLLYADTASTVPVGTKWRRV